MRIDLKKPLFLLGLLLLPVLTHAHAAGVAVSGWHDGFNHPLHGWDHLLVMLAVGIWAAQLRGRAVWRLPLAFVGVMSLGGLAGVAGVSVPGAEMMILFSVVVFGVLVVRRVHFRARASVLIVGFFAFFHGFAHGQEMPASASLLSFGLGFALATLLLHGAGIVTARLAALAFACLLGSSADAQQTTNAPAAKPQPEPQPKEGETVLLPEIVVTGRSDSQVGIADSASQGNVGQEQLKLRPIIRPGEVLETVPGLIVSQHSGEGKANQYYLRGFNLDHGTDFLTQVDGVPVNLVSNAHGQGYTDTGFLIPELVRTLGYQKGVYYAESGDFSSAGAANIQYFNALPAGIAKFTGGSFNYYRGLFASSRQIGDGNFLYALEGNYNDGPWERGDHYKKGNAVLRYSREHAHSGWSATFMGYKADWSASNHDPDTVDGLIGATVQNTNGTDIAVDGNGGKHVVWAGRDGIWYATGTTSFKGNATVIEDWTPPLTHAGPLGRPSVTVDDAAQPWVAYAIDAPDGQDIRVATLEGGAWTLETAATVDECSGCRQSGPAPIAVDAGGPLVVYVDGAAGAVMAARLDGDAWMSEVVETGIAPSGLSVTVDADGTPWVTYYTGDGEVHLATNSGTTWATSSVAEAKPGNGTGNLAETTGVAITADGTVYVSWFDTATNGVHLAGGAQGAAFEAIETVGTEGGGFPSISVTGDGSRVFLAWYDLLTENLLLGVLGEASDILVAQPSPTTPPAPPTSAGPPVECPRGGLELVAPSGAAVSGFAQTTLSAPADEDFTICFDNQDSGVQHNVNVYTAAPPDGESVAAGGIIVGPAQENLDVPGQPAGSYFYQCDVHPTTMTGTLDVA